MAGRPVTKKADIPALKKLKQSNGQIIDPSPIIAYTMRKCGCTFAEIADVIGVTRQGAEYTVKEMEKQLDVSLA